MAVGLIDKITNFIMPLEESVEVPEKVSETAATNKTARLRVHSNVSAEMKMAVVCPLKYEDVTTYADHLKAGSSVIINFTHVDTSVQQCMTDFLNGVCYVVRGSCERVSNEILIYAPESILINKELYAYSIPTYVKQKAEVNE